MTPLTQLIRDRIGAEGPMSLDAFITLAMTHPEQGYYTTRDPLGRGGDFITAPEISQIFGELIGLWAAEVWRAMGRPSPVQLVELGPGRGTMLADGLRAIAAAEPSFFEAAKVHLIEPSPALRYIQAGTLAHIQPAWHDRLAEVGDGSVIILANEVFDALPIRQYVRGSATWHERLVGLDGGGQGLTFVLGPDVDPEWPVGLDDVAEGEIVEVCAAGETLAGEIAARIVASGGAALVIDYGHGHSHPGDTLQAVRGHAYAPVLDAPGQADITHHVDFGVLAAAVRSAGAAVHGPVPQGLFLGRLGAGERAGALAKARPEKAEEILVAARRLIDPRRMGQIFKVLAMTAPELPTPPGFTSKLK